MNEIRDKVPANCCPLVSVVIPSKNRQDLLVSALESVFNQTYPSIEIIVVDDGSDTSLGPLLQKVFGNNFQCLRNEVSFGAAAARNRGAMAAHGEFIAFLDDDDLWLPDKLDRQVDAFKKKSHDVGVVYCGFNFLLGELVVPHQNTYYATPDLRIAALTECPVGSPTPLIKKKFFDMVGGFDVEFPSCQDWDLWIRLSKVCKFYAVTESLALYRVHGNQISTDLSKKIEGRKRILDKHFEDMQAHTDILSAHYSRIGSLCVLANEHDQARKFFCRALSQKNFDFAVYVHLILNMLCKPLEKWLIQRFSVHVVGGIKLIH